MKPVYRGETDSKRVARWLVWSCHQRLLGKYFVTNPNVFLASRIGGDIDTLLEMGVSPDCVWAVEFSREQCEPLFAKAKKKGFRVFLEKIQAVVERLAESESIRSVYLDYCGNLCGTRSSTQRVMVKMAPGSVVSITLFLGRELDGTVDREAALIKQLRAATKHRVTLVQSIRYMSDDEASKGSAMQTWTFFIGDIPSRSKLRFDLTKLDVSTLAKSEKEVRKLWLMAKKVADVRSAAAVLANINR